jgi:carbon starvation protein
MTVLPIIAAAALTLLIAYVVYGRLVARWLSLDSSRRTPAVEFDDGNDFVPAPAPIVLGGHFTAIAAAGPIVGPIVAGLAFGWLPALLWIVLGAIFIGGVHDAAALFASIRHRATSITQVVRQHMSRPAYFTFLIFVWVCLVYVVIAFADVTAGTFSRLQTMSVLVNGEAREFVINGGAVAVGAGGYLLFSIVLGLGLRYLRLHWAAQLAACVLGLGLMIWYSPAIAQWLSGMGLSFFQTTAEGAGVLTKRWDQALLVYCFFASVTPMWILLQPRGVIGATFLYAAIAFGIVGALVGGWSSGGALAIQWPAFKGFSAEKVGLLFPMLFITVACGACSGFHSIVSSGTTCKQLRSEKDVRTVGYGAMLLESLVAVLSLSCVMMLAPGTKTGSPDAVYAQGLGKFMNLCGIPLYFAISFGLLAFSSFVFDTMDVCTRLGRYVMQELTGMKSRLGGWIATFLTLAAPSYYLHINPPNTFTQFWTLFGTSNQLLAALSLVAISVWLWRTGRPVLFTLLPAVFMVATTSTALVINIRTYYAAYEKASGMGEAVAAPLTNLCIAVALLVLSTFVVFEAIRVYIRARGSRARAAESEQLLTTNP